MIRYESNGLVNDLRKFPMKKNYYHYRYLPLPARGPAGERVEYSVSFGGSTTTGEPGGASSINAWFLKPP